MRAFIAQKDDQCLIFVDFKPNKLPDGYKLHETEYNLSEDDNGLVFTLMDDQIIVNEGGESQAEAIFRKPLYYLNYLKEGKTPAPEAPVKAEKKAAPAKAAKPAATPKKAAPAPAKAKEKPAPKEKKPAKPKVVRPPFRVMRGFVNNGKYEFERTELQDDKRIQALVTAALKDSDTREVMISIHRPKVKVAKKAK
jgi:outer membrane biosynthesis protein TonB